MTLRGFQSPDIRPARPDELETCARIWHVALNDYLVRLNQPEWPFDPIGITSLFQHTRATDPDRFLVAVRPEPAGDEAADAGDGERLIGFVSATVRGSLWFLSMLFVLPEEQSTGIGRELLERVLPDPAEGFSLATATDSAQPISNALYSKYGMVPRMPLLNLSGELRRPEALPDLPPGLAATPFETMVATGADGSGHRVLAELVDRLDSSALGATHAVDHAWLRRIERRGFVYRAADGQVLGYGYTSEAGRVGPISVSDPDLMAPILGHLLRAVTPRGAFAVWVPGVAGDCVQALLAAGLRIEPFPILMCWDVGATDYRRYLPNSPGLL